jgi:hypothetical protein
MKNSMDKINKFQFVQFRSLQFISFKFQINSSLITLNPHVTSAIQDYVLEDLFPCTV